MEQPIVAIDARLAGGTSTGDSTYWTGLLHGLASQDHGLRFLLVSNKPKPAEIPDSPAFQWICLPARSSRWWSLATFPLAARRLGAKAIHTQYNLSPLAGRIGLTTIHDVSFFIGPEWFKPRDRMLLQRFVPASARRAARVLTVSETSRHDVEKFIPAARGKVRVSPLAPGLGIQAMERETAQQLVSSELGIQTPFLLTVGTRWPRKNMDLALRAAERLGDALPHRLVVTGKAGWGEEALGSRGIATGFVTDRQLSALYSASDLYLAPSHYEGFGITLLEAFSCRCPVLCSPGGAQAEVAGEAAAIEASKDPEIWAARIREMLGDSSKLESLRGAGEARSRQFTWKGMASLVCAAYREVIQ